MRYETSSAVGATPAQLWAALTDMGHWPEWIEVYREVRREDTGPLRVGSRARVRQTGLAAGDWEVTELVDQERFVWENRQPGVHTVAGHVVAPDGADGSRLTLSLEQHGPLAPVVGMVLGGRIRRYVDLEAAGLKTAAESTA